jgi:hypothetical protein
MIRLVFLLPLFFGCMPKTFEEDALPVPEERPVSYLDNVSDYSTVWSATVEVMGDAAPLDRIQEEEGLIVTGWVQGSSNYIYKNYGGTRIPEPIRYRMVVRLTRMPEGTQIEITSQEQVEKDMISVDMTFTGSIYQWIDVPSNTQKEASLLREIASLLETRRGGRVPDYTY